MSVTILKYEGELNSRVRCVDGCGFGKQLDSIETRGTTTQEQVDRLLGVADKHDRLHSTHKVEVIFYVKRINLEPINLDLVGLPIEQDMLERRREFLRGE